MSRGADRPVQFRGKNTWFDPDDESAYSAPAPSGPRQPSGSGGGSPAARPAAAAPARAGSIGGPFSGSPAPVRTQVPATPNGRMSDQFASGALQQIAPVSGPGGMGPSLRRAPSQSGTPLATWTQQGERMAPGSNTTTTTSTVMDAQGRTVVTKTVVTKTTTDTGIRTETKVYTTTYPAGVMPPPSDDLPSPTKRIGAQPWTSPAAPASPASPTTPPHGMRRVSNPSGGLPQQSLLGAGAGVGGAVGSPTNVMRASATGMMTPAAAAAAGARPSTAGKEQNLLRASWGGGLPGGGAGAGAGRSPTIQPGLGQMRPASPGRVLTAATSPHAAGTPVNRSLGAAAPAGGSPATPGSPAGRAQSASRQPMRMSAAFVQAHQIGGGSGSGSGSKGEAGPGSELFGWGGGEARPGTSSLRPATRQSGSGGAVQRRYSNAGHGSDEEGGSPAWPASPPMGRGGPAPGAGQARQLTNQGSIRRSVDGAVGSLPGALTGMPMGTPGAVNALRRAPSGQPAASSAGTSPTKPMLGAAAAAASAAKPGGAASPARPAAAAAAAPGKPVAPAAAIKPGGAAAGAGAAAGSPVRKPAAPGPPAAAPPPAKAAPPAAPVRAPSAVADNIAKVKGAVQKAVGINQMLTSLRRNAGLCAVSLAFLKRFRTKLLRERPSDAAKLTTSMVVMEVIKPLTESHACRLTDHPDLTSQLLGESDVGGPDYFISHAWSMPFLHLLEAIFSHLQGALDSTHVWLDIFAVNQHPGAEQKDDLSNLRTAIQMSQATLVIMDSAGTPLERVWCLYEFDNTLALKGADALVLLTPGFSVREIANIFRSIDVDNAKATVISDKDMILADIRAKHGSTQAFNAKLKLRFLLDPIDMKPDMAALAARAGTDAQQWNFAPVSQWLAQPAAPQVAMLAATAGTGKSTISAVLCMGPEEAARLAALPPLDPTQRPTTAPPSPERRQAKAGPVTVHGYHFCKYSDARRQDPVRIVKTLAYQLAHAFPALQPYYCGLDPGQLMQLSAPDAACRELLLAPLQSHCRGQQVLILLDALDEADKQPHMQPQHAGGAGGGAPPAASALDNKALQLLLHQLSLLPPSVRILTTLRPEQHLVDPLRSRFTRLQEFNPMQLRRAEKTQASMQARLVERFGSGSADKLLAASSAAGSGSSNLVYFPVVLLLRAPLERVPASLYEAYAAVFDQLWPSEAKLGGQLQQLLEVLVAAQEPPPMSLVAGLGLQGALRSLPGWGVLFFERDHHVHVLHRTLMDWLQDRRAAGKRHAEPRKGHTLLGRHLLASARPLSVYGARYLATHLILAGSEPALLDKALLDMGYLEQACRTGDVFKLHAELAALPEQRQTAVVRDVVRWLGLNGHVLWSHPAAVVQLCAEAPKRSSIWQAASKSSKRPPVDLQNEPEGWPLEVTSLTQHKAPVSDVAYSPDGRLLVSASLDGTVRLWDACTGEPKAVLPATPAHALAYSPTGHLMATGGEQGAVQLWDPTTGVQRSESRNHRDTVTVLVFSVDGGMLASGSRDKTIRIWQTFNGTERAQLKGHTGPIAAVVFSPDGTLLASAAEGDATVRLWEPSSGALRCALQGHRQSVHSLAFSPSGALLASGSEDYTVRIWDGVTGAPKSALTDHIFPVQAVAFSPDGKMLASADNSHTVRLWDLGCITSGSAGPKGKAGAGPGAGVGAGGVRQRACIEAESGGQLTAMAFSPSGGLLATGAANGELHVFDTAQGAVSSVRAAHAGAVRRLAFAPDTGALVSASDDCTLRLWDPRGAGAGSGSGPEGHTGAAAFSTHYTRSGRVVACLSEDGALTLWDAGNACPMAESARAQGAGRPTVTRLSPDEGTLAVGEAEGGNIRLWDLGSGRLRARLKGHSDVIRDVAFSPAGDAIVSGSDDCRVRLWSATNGQQIAVLTGHTAGVLAVAFSPETTLVASGSEDGSIRIWPTSGQTKAVAVLKAGSTAVLRLAFSPDGAMLASGQADGSVKLWDVHSGQQVSVLKCSHKEPVRRMVWAASGRLLVSASRGDGPATAVVAVSDVRTGEQMYVVHAADMVSEDAACPGMLCTIVSTMEHAPHLTLVSEARGGPAKPGPNGAPPALPAGITAAADGRLHLRQVPVYTSFAAPACMAVRSDEFVMAFGTTVNFYRC